MKNIGCFLLFSFLLMQSAAFAGDVTLFGGVQHPGNISLRSAAQGAVSIPFDPKSFGVFGVRVGIGRKIFGNETTFAYNPNFIDSTSKALILANNLVVQVPTPAVRPYATAGLGVVWTKGSGLSDIGSKFAVNYGGGLKVALPGPFGLRFDARGYTLPSVQSQTLNIIEVSFGVVIGF